jgi:hypothetical protein
MSILSLLALIILSAALWGLWRARRRGPSVMRAALGLLSCAIASIAAGWLIIHHY